MKSRRSVLALGVGLVALSTALYLVLYTTLGRGEEIVFLLIHAVAFLPIEFLLVTLIVDGVLAVRTNPFDPQARVEVPT